MKSYSWLRDRLKALFIIDEAENKKTQQESYINSVQSISTNGHRPTHLEHISSMAETLYTFVKQNGDKNCCKQFNVQIWKNSICCLYFSREGGDTSQSPDEPVSLLFEPITIQIRAQSKKNLPDKSCNLYFLQRPVLLLVFFSFY